MNDSDKTFSFLRRKARESAATRWSRKELAQIVLLKGAHQETIAPLLRDCPVKLLASGDVLLPAGEACEAVYIVLSGRLQMEGTSSTAPTALIRPGECVGELFLMRKAIVTGAVSATESTRLLVIDRNSAWALIRASHDIATNWLSLFSERSQASGIIGAAVELKTAHASQLTHDECTGLYNRHWLESILPRLISRTTSSSSPLGFLLAEIDGFANYVVQYGTVAGDRTCRAVAKIFVDNVRPTDLVVSYGTAQFAAILPDADVASACRAGERIRQAMNQSNVAASEENGAPALTLSIGATEFQPSTDASALLTTVETALHMAKLSGGNRVGMQ